MLKAFRIGLFGMLWGLTSISVWANMASPIFEGTKSSSMIISRDLDVLSESIHIRADKAFRLADFNIVYNIKSDHSGKLPLMFLALDYEGDFVVKVDGKYLSFVQLSDTSALAKRLGINDSLIDQKGKVHIRLYDNYEDLFQLNQLVYFEPFISKGLHTIEVYYKAKFWSNMGEEIVRREFRYSLTPAKFWRSFGHLKVTYDNSEFNQAVTWNLDTQKTSDDKRILKAEFGKLPSEFILITYVPVLKFGEYISVRLANHLSGILFIVLLAFLLYRVIVFRKGVSKWGMVFLSIGFLLLPILILFVREGFLNYGKGSDSDIVSHQRDYGTFLYFPFKYLMYLFFLLLIFRIVYVYKKRSKKDNVE
ncbi:MAG TPA: hypothetical protein VGF79_14955 [Bacteroidia bacterium]